MTSQMVQTTIQIDRKAAGMVAQALEDQADALRKRSNSRSNSGPQLAEVRAKMRAKASRMDEQANAIFSQLRDNGSEV